ncbi:hypothetical protein Tco_1543915, partial [Tanacetum coccineum]
MTGVPRTIMIGGEAFNTKHRVNELKHLEPVKQKKRSLALERNEAIHTQVEELAKANIFHQLGRHIEVNADDIVIKSNVQEEMLAAIKEILDGLRAINLKLNPKKCSFSVEEGVFSGYLITKKGILRNCTSGKMVQWTTEADKAFQRMKELLEALPT